MDATSQVPPKKFVETMKDEIEQYAKEVMEAVNEAPDAERHRLLAEHFTAEYRVKTEGRGRVVDEWKPRPGAPDNHWLDCLVGCAVAASMHGVALSGMEKHHAVLKRKRLTMAQLAAARQRRE